MSKITEPASRKKILRQKGLCFIYFSEEHLVSSCKLHYVCRKCNGKHHISICTFEPSKSNVTNPPSQDDSVEATTNNFSSNKNTVLLQTALATATNTSGNLHSETLLLFDSGSQRTYISTELREKLKLPAVRQKTILIKTFGQSAFSAQTRGGGSIFKLKGPRCGFKFSLVSRLGLMGQKNLKISYSRTPENGPICQILLCS